jgi:hypothetical protein
MAGTAMKSTLRLCLEFEDIYESSRRAALASRLDDISVLVRHGACDGALFHDTSVKASGAFLVEHADPAADEDEAEEDVT